MRKLFFIISFALFFVSFVRAQTHYHLQWEPISTWQIDTVQTKALSLKDGAYLKGVLPWFICNQPADAKIQLRNAVFDVCSVDEDSIILSSGEDIPDSLRYFASRVKVENKLEKRLVIFPYVKANGGYKKLISFDAVMTSQVSDLSAKNLSKSNNGARYALNSVLGSGNFVKIRVSQNGLYKLTYTDLVDMGISSPNNVKIYGYGGAMLSEDFSEPYIDDLPEVRIYMNKGSDGIFNKGDYILFYGQGAICWKYQSGSGRFVHTQNPYSDYGYYFITSGVSSGKRMEQEATNTSTPSSDIKYFIDYYCHDKDSINLANSGRTFYGETFGSTGLIHTFSVPFDNLLDTVAVINVNAAAYGFSNTSFSISIDDKTVGNFWIHAITSTTTDYARKNAASFIFTPVSGDHLNVKLTYSSSASKGWLDYFELNVRRQLIKKKGEPLFFRNTDFLNQSKVQRYVLQGADKNTQVWEVTDHQNMLRIPVNYDNGTITFISTTDTLREFVAVNPDEDGFYVPKIVGTVANQNLHALPQADMIVITAPDLINQAQMLANYHMVHDGMKVDIATSDDIYNEFSSGTPDATAYRRFVKMFYDRSFTKGTPPKYLLLFGDGCFDNRHLLPSSTTNNIYQLLTYQSENSISATNSYVTDDYFGFLDDADGSNFLLEMMDIGVGRIPVYDATQANQVVNKIIGYMDNTNVGSWKNQLVYVADDEDHNLHMSQADSIAREMAHLHPDFLIKKLYLDAYSQETTASGQTYPQVYALLSNYFKFGSLLINYNGHGSWVGWAAEKILTNSEIEQMYNKNLPVLVTATCDFTRFDDYETSAGENIFFNPLGGAVALFTTTRAVYSAPNFQLNLDFTDFVFSRDANGRPLKMGDVMKLAKNERAKVGDSNRMSFTLIGDPAMPIHFPYSHRVIVDTINGKPLQLSLRDTLNSLDMVTLEGHLQKYESADSMDIDSTFNGTVYLSVFDKQEIITTLCNDCYGTDTAFVYKDRTNTLFSGSAKVKSGKFNFTFLMPKDIKYNFGTGRMVFYAVGDSNKYEGHGSTENLVIGGENSNHQVDNDGPEIDAYLNTRNFKSGDYVNSTPLFTANLSDLSGINTTGNGIGHDLILQIDGDPLQETVLNPYYQSVLGNYQQGEVRYQLPEMTEGKHTLFFRAWDLQNNSSSVSFDFNVSNHYPVNVYSVYVYPNPVPASGTVHFVFNHDRPSALLTVLATVYDIAGRVIWQKSKQTITDDSSSTDLAWNLSESVVRQGFYIVKLSITTEDGTVSNKSVKLIVR